MWLKHGILHSLAGSVKRQTMDLCVWEDGLLIIQDLTCLNVVMSMLNENIQYAWAAVRPSPQIIPSCPPDHTDIIKLPRGHRRHIGIHFHQHGLPRGKHMVLDAAESNIASQQSLVWPLKSHNLDIKYSFKIKFPLLFLWFTDNSIRCQNWWVFTPGCSLHFRGAMAMSNYLHTQETKPISKLSDDVIITISAFTSKIFTR